MIGFVANEGQARYEKYCATLIRNRKNNYRRVYESIENNRLEMIDYDKNREVREINRYDSRRSYTEY